ncbi:DUF4116 domain-containing protein [Sulfuricurvum sp.]|uniref:DUF4116 domain-containing protein n=1 Tax=Sulfuricurvum sp. TaxID=2025608 RepID=UPI002601F035|nr:DUF4116 domain-containing protein [Sulfuricurvum sp.]MDD3595218.1 DUF4116 domain-containing protein [Sulfuricurvum sp.]
MKAPVELRDNPDFIFRGIVRFGYTIMSIASTRLKNDPIFMLKAIEASGYTFMYASSSLKKNRKFIQNALEISSIIYPDLQKKWQIEFVEYGLRSPCINFKYLPSKYRNDLNIIHQCLGSVYRDIKVQYRDDEMLCKKAIRLNPHNYTYASQRLQNDPTIVMAAVMSDGSMLEDVPEKFRDDENIVYLAVSKYSSSFQFASQRLRDNDEIARMAIMDDPCNFRYASERLRDDDVLAQFAMDGYGRFNYEYLSLRLQQNPMMISLKNSFTLDDGFMGCQ